MAEFKLTDAIDASILTNLGKISQELNDVSANADRAAKKYADLATALGKLSQVKPDNIEALAKKLNECNGVIAQMNQVQSQLTQLQTAYTTLVGKTNQVLKENAEAAKQAAQVTREQAKAEQEVQKAEQQRIKTEQAKEKAQKQSRLTTEEALALARQEVKSINEANQANTKLRAAVRAITEEEDKEGKVRAQLNAAIQRNTQYVKQNSDAYVQQKMNVGNYTKSIREALNGISTGTNVMKNFGIIARSTGGILGAEVSAQVSAVGSGLKNMIAGFVGAQAVIAGVQKMIEAFKYGVSTIVDFEAANSRLAAVLGTNLGGIKALTDQAMQLGSTTSYTASQVTALQTELAKLGFTQKEITDVTEGVLKFAKAVGTDLASASSVAGAALRMFGADSSEMERYVSAMAVGTTKSALSFYDLQVALSTVGPVANAFGFKIEDVVTLLGKLKDAGFDASSAGTATRNIFLNMADSGGKLAQALGRPITNMNDLATGLQTLRDRGVSLAEALDLTDKRSVAAFESFLNAADSLTTLRSAVTDVTGELDDMANTMQDNVQGSILSAQSAWEGLMLTFMESKGIMKEAVDFITRGIKNIKYAMSDAQEQQKQMNLEYYNANKTLIEGSEGIIETSKDRIRGIYDERVKAGQDAAEAEEQIRQEELARLQKDADRQQKVMDELVATREKAQKKMDNSFRFSLSYSQGSTMYKNAQKEIAALNFEMEKTARLQKAIGGLDLDGSDSQATPTSAAAYMSDKQKKEAEKAAKERLKVEQALQDSITALMDEGLQKELQKIRDSYEKKMAQYKGNSKEEVQLRLNLSMKMNEEITRRTQEYELKAAIEVAQARKAAAKEGTEEALKAQLELMELQYAQERQAVKDNEELLVALEEKYQAQREQIREAYASKRVKKIQEEYAVETAIITNAMNDEILSVEQMYARREITEEQRNQAIARIKEEYAIGAAHSAIDLLEEQLRVEDLSEEQRESLAEKLTAAKIALSERETEAIIANNKRQEDSHRKTLEAVQSVVEYVGDALSGAADFGVQMYENQLDKLSRTKDELDKAHEEEIARIEALESTGSISAEEAEARKRAARAKSEAQNKQIAKEQEMIERRQARLAKATAIAQATMATALAIMRVYADPGNGTFISRGVMAGIVGALGAVQLATIAATPLSAYAKGTDDAKGGPSLVGDGGKREVIVFGGHAYLTPDTPTMIDMPKHAKVIPDVQTWQREFGKDWSDLNVLMTHRDRNGMPVVQLSNDFSGLEKTSREVTQEQTDLLLKEMRRNARSNYMNQYIAGRI